jgi:hypothetical protein
MGNFYDALCTEHTPDRRFLDMDECAAILCHSLMQCGDPVWKYIAAHLKYSQDLTSVHDFGTGCKVRTDTKGIVANSSRGTSAAAPNQRLCAELRLRNKQKKSKWRLHQSLALTKRKRGRCCCC